MTTSQIGIIPLPKGGYDLALKPHIQTTSSLQTSIALSLLTDKRSVTGQLPEGFDRGGWWGDTYPIASGDQFGSWLWTLRGLPKTDATLQLADSYARDALRWLIEDGIADRFELEKEFRHPGLRVRVGIVHSTAIRWTDWWAFTL